MLVIVVVAFVFIECETAIGSGIDAYFKVIPWLFGGILYVWADGEDATGTHIERDVIECGFCFDSLSAGKLPVGFEVIP